MFLANSSVFITIFHFAGKIENGFKSFSLDQGDPDCQQISQLREEKRNLGISSSFQLLTTIRSSVIFSCCTF